MTSINAMQTQPYSPPQMSNDGDTQAERASRSKRGIADISKRWPDGEVTVSIEGADKETFKLIEKAIAEWEQYTPGIKIKIKTDGPGDIRISLIRGGKGDWSRIGTQAKNYPKDEVTMHLDPDKDKSRFYATVLHEFGHALGLEHEHQHPDGTIKLDFKAIRKKLPPMRDRDFNGNYKPLPREGRLVTPYDEHSIMHFGFNANQTKDGRSYNDPHRLTAGDKETIRKLYTPKKFQQINAETSQ